MSGPSVWPIHLPRVSLPAHARSGLTEATAAAASPGIVPSSGRVALDSQIGHAASRTTPCGFGGNELSFPNDGNCVWFWRVRARFRETGLSLSRERERDAREFSDGTGFLFEEPNPTMARDFIQEGNRAPVSKATHSRYRVELDIIIIIISWSASYTAPSYETFPSFAALRLILAQFCAGSGHEYHCCHAFPLLRSNARIFVSPSSFSLSPI